MSVDIGRIRPVRSGPPPAVGRHPHLDNALLVGQTRVGRATYVSSVPTRPSQNNPDRVAQWERWRAMVGANIRELRLQHGMTQEALALTSGVTRNVLIDVEQGKRGLLYERLFDIAEALQVNVTALFDGSTDTG
jgi:DNA-binding XRE family transcriptional regulator